MGVTKVIDITIKFTFVCKASCVCPRCTNELSAQFSDIFTILVISRTIRIANRRDSSIVSAEQFVRITRSALFPVVEDPTKCLKIESSRLLLYGHILKMQKHFACVRSASEQKGHLELGTIRLSLQFVQRSIRESTRTYNALSHTRIYAHAFIYTQAATAERDTSIKTVNRRFLFWPSAATRSCRRGTLLAGPFLRAHMREKSRASNGSLCRVTYISLSLRADARVIFSRKSI